MGRARISSMKTVLITGANSGFGFRLTEELLKKGWRVFAGVRRLESRRSLFQDLDRVYGHHLELFELDLENSTQLDQLLARLSERRVELDCLINNAGYGQFGALEDLSEKQLRQQFEVNFFGVFFLTRRLLPQLRNKKGRIINISSTLGFTGMPLAGAYCASKFAVEGMSECLALDLEAHGVQVCCVEPGAFKTKFGENMKWGDSSFSPQSPYSESALAMKRFRENRTSPPMEPVVTTVLSLCESPKIPLRVCVGKDAKLAYWMRKFLPQGVYHSLLSFAFQRAFAKKSA